MDKWRNLGQFMVLETQFCSNAKKKAKINLRGVNPKYFAVQGIIKILDFHHRFTFVKSK